MHILLNDIQFNKSLYPFGEVKSIAHIRAGIFTIFEKWDFLFPGKVLISSENELATQNTDAISIPANIIPSLSCLEKTAKEFSQLSFEDCKVLEYPWQIMQYNGWCIHEDFKLITSGRKSKNISQDNQLIHPENIFIEEDATVNFSILNATDGPIYIGKNAQVEEGCLIRGPFTAGEGCRIKMGTKIYGATTIGPYCLAGGEIKNSVLMSYSNKGHDGYLGDSVIGSWCNLGAGTSNSNIKNTAGNVKMWSKEKDEWISAGNKCGLIMGDYSRSAINTSFNTGTIAGICCNIFGNIFSSKVIDDFKWGNEKYIFEKAITDINNWKKLKGHEITEDEISKLKNIYQTKNK